MKSYVKNIAQLQILKTLIFVSSHRKFNQLEERLKISEVKIEIAKNSVKKKCSETRVNNVENKTDGNFRKFLL